MQILNYNNMFEKLAPYIQEYIYKKGWHDLNEVQKETGVAIFDTDNHIIVSSGTSSGKTEACMFPILTKIHENPSTSISVIYISPLKALINDQFLRISEILKSSNMPVYSWHGDIVQSQKDKVLKNAKGILQITPESLESLIMRKPSIIYDIFHDLRFVVIDEIHSFMNMDRGLQTICLISRIESMAKCNPRRIGLSATLNDYDTAKDFLQQGTNKNVTVTGLSENRSKRKVQLYIDSFYTTDENSTKFNDFVYKQVYNKKAIIFTNNRDDAEKIIQNMKAISRKNMEPDIFKVHHGSLSAQLRSDVEIQLKKDEPIVSSATLTLELGIDIGDLDLTVQTGTPLSVSSFVQRLGRSGRRTGKSTMVFALQHMWNDESIDINDMPWDFIKTISIIELYLKERWVEPVSIKPKPFSLLVHQTLSILYTHVDLSAKELAYKILSLPVFNNKITQSEYKDILLHMIQNKYIQQLDNGNLILGKNGDYLVNHYSFYAVFEDNIGFRVYNGKIFIGTVDKIPKESFFLLGGSSWKLEKIDEKANIIYVSFANAIDKTYFSSNFLDNTHTKIIEKMKHILSDDEEYAYLSKNAKNLLKNFRKASHDIGILKEKVIMENENSFLIAPWVGSKELNSIFCILKYKFPNIKLKRKNIFIEIILNENTNISDVITSLREIQLNNNEEMIVPRNIYKDKFDNIIPIYLLKKAYIENHMDIKKALQTLQNIEKN